MKLVVAENAETMGCYAATLAASAIRAAIEERGNSRIVVATGASQFTVLSHLVQQPDIDWSRVTGFHLDEYVGLSPEHPASFCRYLKERFVDRVPLTAFHYLRGDADAAETIQWVASELIQQPIDVALVGIGENGHLAFNDPPADFETEAPYLVLPLDEACRQQQVGEGWFDSLADVPSHAMSMSVHRILQSKQIVCSVPDERKAEAVRASVEGTIAPEVPASILRRHEHATLVVDPPAASLLGQATLEAAVRVDRESVPDGGAG
ncbi:MAG: glucosamine-6-phosphate deaminase [Planctomycetota bacterium]